MPSATGALATRLEVTVIEAVPLQGTTSGASEMLTGDERPELFRRRLEIEFPAIMEFMHD